MDDETKYLQLMVAYWKHQTLSLREVVNQLEYTSRPHTVPPEPPLHSEYWTGTNLAWILSSGGWHCRSESCANCPASWDEVWSIVGATTWDYDLVIRGGS